MDEIEKIIEETFAKKIFDKKSKKILKTQAEILNLEHDDLNFLIKKAFELFKEGIKIDATFFLVDWLQEIINTINDLKSKVYTVTDIKFSPVNDCTSSIINFIKSAKNSLFICVFTISDNEISKEIIAKYKEGVDVKIISDNEKQYDKGSDIQEFSDAGIKVKVDETRHHMHHKFAIADQKQLLTGSYNWTRSASMYNQENLMILNDASAVKRYLDEFYRLWKTSVPL
jgi:mitochondrial cardiolipin hydrolase